jgi:hypothetical protein
MGGGNEIITEIEVFKISIFIILLAFDIWLFLLGGMVVITGVPY